jgi:hypothetical protein
MALTWATIIAGFALVFGLPIAVLLLNRRWRYSGWWLLVGLIGLIIVGNIVEKTFGS